MFRKTSKLSYRGMIINPYNGCLCKDTQISSRFIILSYPVSHSILMNKINGIDSAGNHKVVIDFPFKIPLFHLTIVKPNAQ
jgi:hypothetical protein